MTRNDPDVFPSLVELSLDDWLAEVADLMSQDGGLEHLGSQHHAILSQHGPTLFVAFETLQGILSISPLAQPIGWDMTKRHGWSSLSLLSRGDTWFRDPEIYTYFDKLIDEEFFDSFDQVIFYGAGSCAHAAAAFSVAAPGARVLAVQPQATLDTDQAGWDPRFPHMRRTDFRTRYGYAPDMLEAAQAAYVVFDPLEREDAMHARLFQAPHVTSLRMQGLGGALQTDLWQMQILHQVLEQAATDALTQVSFARALRARRSHLPYLNRLLRRLDRDDRDELAEMLCRNVSARLKAPRFAQRANTSATAQ
ncbi:MAG: phosphoadenosine phosphosulfate reductase [Roseobacter sp.]